MPICITFGDQHEFVEAINQLIAKPCGLLKEQQVKLQQMEKKLEDVEGESLFTHQEQSLLIYRVRELLYVFQGTALDDAKRLSVVRIVRELLGLNSLEAVRFVDGALKGKTEIGNGSNPVAPKPDDAPFA